ILNAWPWLAWRSSWIFASSSAIGCSKSRKFGFIRDRSRPRGRRKEAKYSGSGRTGQARPGGSAARRARRSVQRLPETVEARLPAIEDVGRGQQVVGAPDQAFARDHADPARVLAVVAVVAEHEGVAGRNRERAEVARGRTRQELYAAHVATAVLGRVQRGGRAAIA